MRFVAVILLLVGVAVAVDPPLQPFSSADGRFVVQFPGGAPKVETQSVPLKNGQTCTMNQFWVELENGSLSYMVMYNDYPPGFITDTSLAAQQTRLEQTRNGAINGKTLISDTPIALNGAPGRAFSASDKDFHYDVRQYMVGMRLYQLIIVSTDAHPPTQRDQFFSSFLFH
jgi:hypothetical protein